MKIHKTLLLATILSQALFVTAQSQNPSDSIARLRSELEPRITDATKKNELAGLAIGVVKDGKLIYAKGFGVSRLGSDSPVTSKSLFHMASVTKTFVATSIMQLVDQGKIDLDQPLTRYLSYFRLNDDRYRSITVRQMLSHTSGIPDIDDYHWDKPEYDDGALERFVRSIANEKLIAAPGAKFAYSNTAYEALGDVIAKVSGESFEAYVQHHILVPLGMNDSTLLVREANQQLLTSPHVFKDGKVTVSRIFPYNRAHAPSSTLYSNIEDMSRWAIANLNHGELDGQRILKQQTAEAMWKPVVQAGARSKEGISWFLMDDDGRHFVLHSGGDVGFQSLLVLDPGDSLAVVAMANLDSGKSSVVNDAVNMAIRIMLGRPAVSPKESAPAKVSAALPTDDSRKKADEVLASYVTALGGRSALERVTSRVARGTFEVKGWAAAGPAEVYAKAPNKTVTVLHLPGGLMAKDGFDGAVGWQLDPEEGMSDTTGLEAGSAMRDADFYQALKLRGQYPSLFFLEGRKIELEKEDSEQTESRDVQILEAPRNGTPRLFYFDLKSGLLLRVEDYNVKGEVETTDFDDYREVDGVKVPFINRHKDSGVRIVIKYTEIKQNIPIDDAVFVKSPK